MDDERNDGRVFIGDDDTRAVENVRPLPGGPCAVRARIVE